ncbi:polysaccharide biosynthesis/export family protein [Parahaliea aestuarii]|uniref:Polysaccharide export protein n=1 Tax=Parahaliea aestuarii TaxID=1852021 RepID=A0A5C8ZPP3_9GAMM|nr:polysaccharide biosynthesis/export family protein [Parahaliea aestuarii]TXS90473.1 polysaccharide export protein [Parahaliea aestuarii]
MLRNSANPFGLWITTLLALSLSLSAQGVNSADAYQLGAGDHILIQVFDEPDLSMSFRLSESGTVNYPLLGEVEVEGLTVRELEARITSGLLGDYLVNPDVTVAIEEYRPIYIDGEVRQPGGFPYQPGLTVQKVVALAGGFTERALRDRIALQPAKDPASEQSVGLDYTIRPGDVITVKRSFF